MKIIGEIKEIFRYPVKSFEGESLDSTDVDAYGIYGDRSHVFIDETREGKNLSAKQVPKLLGYKARFIDSKAGSSPFPQVEITTPDGEKLLWGEDVLHHIEQLANRKLSLKQYSRDSTELLGVDAKPILITTDSSLRELEKEWGKSLDVLRFRPNFVISLYEDIPFIELTWIEKRLHIHDVQLNILKGCKRCSMINVEPSNYLDIDSSLLQTVVAERNSTFGIYTSVVQTGKIKVGDKVYIVD